MEMFRLCFDRMMENVSIASVLPPNPWIIMMFPGMTKHQDLVLDRVGIVTSTSDGTRA
ncbi:hypothetical protein N825_37390 [Skermanella stibiiresistens SB22]|uniref:Uncharacterized protein n=1 Tax=Skermanella stibiiresistens SB22 TaxID=1385369 RepID=W9GPN6_9PROT|nr:hypothetical protein N825_37390 [Skermanella stibiiresistens SB22]